MTRRCTKCKADKPESDFYGPYKRGNGRGWQRPRKCKACKRAVQARRREKCGEEYRLAWRIWWAKNKDRHNAARRARARSLRLTGGAGAA